MSVSVWDEVAAVRTSAHLEHAETLLEGELLGSPRWLSALVKEVGDVGSALTGRERADLRRNLLSALAVSSHWVDSIDSVTGSDGACVQDEVAARRRPHLMHALLENKPSDSPRWFPALVEDIGEVASALTYDGTADLRRKLLDVMAVLWNWVDSCDRAATAVGSGSSSKMTVKVMVDTDDVEAVLYWYGFGPRCEVDPKTSTWLNAYDHAEGSRQRDELWSKMPASLQWCVHELEQRGATPLRTVLKQKN